MNTHEAKEFTEMYVACCEVSGKTFNKTIMLMYVKALENSDFQAIKKAMSAFFEESKFPSIVDIRSRIGEKVDSPEEQARLFTEKVIAALRNFGGPNEKAAKEHFGEDWDIVTGYQTWGTHCELLTEAIPFFRGQFRPYAELRFRAKNVEKLKQESLPSGDIIDTEAFSIVDDQIKTLLSSMDRT
jgi:hypothetical protein